MKNLNDTVTSSIENFGRDNAYFTREFETHLGIIRRYDEILTQKASKIQLYELEQRIKREIEPQLHKVMAGI